MNNPGGAPLVGLGICRCLGLTKLNLDLALVWDSDRAYVSWPTTDPGRTKGSKKPSTACQDSPARRDP